MVSVTNANNKPSPDDLAALLRSSSTTANNTPAKDAAATSQADDTSRGPAVQIDLSALNDLLTRAQALDALKSNSDDASKVLSGQVKSGNDALNALDQANKNTASDRKADAEKKLEAAQKKLQLLQILGDPKTLASEAKQIGKDIKDAATQYTKALKDGASGGTVAAGAVPGAPTAATIGSPVTDAANDPAAAASSSAIGTAAPAVGTAPSTSGTPSDAAKATGDASTVQAQAAQPQAPVLSPADQAQVNAQKYLAGQHDRDVLSQFKQAAGEVKQALQFAAQKLKASHPSDPDAKTGPQQTKDLDKAVENLSDTIQIQQSGGDISEPSGSAGTATPTVDILA